MKIECLDHGFVRLVSYMQPVPNAWAPGDVGVGLVTGRASGWTGDLEIVRNARTSYNADWRENKSQSESKSDERLINYLYEHDHTTPFEAMVFTFEVQAPIFVFRQWHRHRTWSYNEVSARYTELPDLFYIPDADQVRAQSKKNKQGRDEEMDPRSVERFRQQLIEESAAQYSSYQFWLQQGLARELARVFLPLNIYSRMFATVDLHNLFHFLELRLDEHAQYEIRVYAEALRTLVASVCPVAVEAFDSKFFAPNGG